MSKGITRDELLAAWRRDVDPAYSDPLETQDAGRGLDPISGMAAVLARASSATLATTQAIYLRTRSTQLAPPASGGVKGSATVQVYRGITVGGPVILDTGALLTAVFRGVDGEELLYPEYEVAQDATVLPGSVGPTAVQVRATREGFQGNVPAGTPGRFRVGSRASIAVDHSTPSGGSLHVFADTALADKFLPTMEGQFFRFTSGSNNGQYARLIAQVVADDEIILDDSATMLASGAGTGEVLSVGEVANLTIVFADGVTNGRSAELDYLARERGGQGRALNESDDAFRDRVLALPDVVSPNAVIRAASGALVPLGVPFQFIEAFGHGVGFFYSGTSGPSTNAKNFYDDPKAFRKGRFYSGGPAGGSFPLGFIIVVDGGRFALLADQDAALSALIHAVVNVKPGGVPWAIAFEPPLP